MPTEPIVLVEAPSAALLESVYRLRVLAWRRRFPAFPDIARWTDAFDARAWHVVLTHRDAPVAAARLTVHASLSDAPDAAVWRDLPLDIAIAPVGVLTRAVVHPDFAGQGLSTRLDRARLAAALAGGCGTCLAATNAGHRRVAQLRDLGFTEIAPGARQADGPLSSLPPPVRLAVAFP